MFWILVLVLTVLTSAVLVWPLLKTESGENRNPGAAGITLVLVPVASILLYFQLGNAELAEIQYSGPPPQEAVSNQNMHMVGEMIGRLSTRLKTQPDDAEGWMLLGRSYTAIHKYQEAVLAFKRAIELVGEQPQLLADYAEAMALANNNRFDKSITDLVQRVLELQPENPKGLWLAGIGAAYLGDNASAVLYWERLLPLLPAAGNQVKTLKNYIAQARTQLPMELEPSIPASGDAVAGMNAKQVSVNVSIAPDLNGLVEPEDSVFIFARAQQGPPMPLAVVRKKAKELPVKVTLDDSSAMTPAMKISNFENVIIAARVSKSADAGSKPGDLEGQSGVFELASVDIIDIVIDRVVK